LLGRGDPIVEVPCPGSLALSTADADDRAGITSTYGPIAQSIRLESSCGARQPVPGPLGLGVAAGWLIPPSRRVIEDGEQVVEVP
jgi:hypothetical protein